MSEISPLMSLILKGLRGACMVVVALLLLIDGVFLWSRHQQEGFVWQNGDMGMLGLFGALLLFDLYLIRSIGRELRGPRV